MTDQKYKEKKERKMYSIYYYKYKIVNKIKIMLKCQSA